MPADGDVYHGGWDRVYKKEPEKRRVQEEAVESQLAQLQTNLEGFGRMLKTAGPINQRRGHDKSYRPETVYSPKGRGG